MTAVQYLILGLAAVPAIYYFLVLFSTARFFATSRAEGKATPEFTPPVSCLKPIRGLDVEAYENYASFCRQDYPDYEILFCVDENDPAVPVLQRIVKDFPNRRIRLLYGSGRDAINDKVARLVRLVNEASHDMLVITDGDVRVRPDYLRTVVAPFRDPNLGAATCLYVSTKENTFLEQVQSIGMVSDFFAGIMVAWQLDGVKFTFAQSILTTRKNLEGFGGYETIENRPADDLWIGRLADEQGLKTKLLPYVVQTVADFKSFRELIHKRLRWMTVMRRMRPWGHLGLVFTWGLPWSLIAIAVHPTAAVALGYFGTYLVMRIAMTLLLGTWGMKQRGIWKQLPLIPLWDSIAFCIWLVSFSRSTIRWRGIDYRIRGGILVPVASK